MTNVNPGELEALRASLLGWYDGQRRDLPWREAGDPYGVWVSEVMLQQTRVATVLDYYARWMERFPTTEALAEATLDDVLGQWQGLGYYRRARFLHEAARIVVERYDGELPRTAEQLLELPGVGRYTSAAVASIAFGEPVPVVDGNVERVLARMFRIEDEPRRAAGRRKIERRASELLDHGRPGDHNQAVMELGATVCTPTSPSCEACPVAPWCEARAVGSPEDYPVSGPRQKQRETAVRTAVVWRERHDATEVLVTRRPDEGLLAGMWEFPTVDVDGSIEECVRQLGVRAGCGSDIGEFVHLFSHIRMTLSVEAREGEGEALTPARWVAIDELDEVAFPAAMRRAERLFLEWRADPT